MTRRFWVWLHRWVGLGMTLFLVIAGLTGSLLAFNVELERFFAPQLFATPRPGVAHLDLATLATRAQALVPQARLTAVWLTEDDQASVYFEPRTDAATGRPYDLGFTEFFVDPWTGHELGRRVRGDLSQGRVNIMPFLYDLHWRLVAGDVGQWTMGTVALLWTLDSFNGFYLTLPVSLGRFWRRWKRSWSIKRGGRAFRLNFDVHRATGLWVWPLLFVFAWSSVMMNVRPVYERVMQAVFDYESPMVPFTSEQHPNDAPRLDWHAALATGQRLMAEQAAAHGFNVGKPLSLMYFPDTGGYLYEVRGSRDVFERSPKGGGTDVLFDGDTGALRTLSQPTGEHSGNTVESWLYALHMARVFGLPYRILVFVLGLVVPMLSITGVYIWWKKRASRRFLAAVVAASQRALEPPAQEHP
ncbi:MAG TPA: PepSY-associated TM helix domain-containing protein [Gemmatimonadales bacterium]|nr:PepSY-associated TM helix domain-containing protein [Gemmatimonadales bacterium]